MLDDIKQSYITKADLIPNWLEMSANELADSYIDTEDPNMRSAYFAALVCHYWFYIKVFIRKNKSSDIPVEECYNWLIEALLRVLGPKWGQRWRVPDNALYGDPKAVDKSIKTCLASVRAGYYQDANRVKRKANYITDSLESFCDEYGDYYFNLMDLPSSAPTASHKIIQEYFDKGQFIEGTIIDEICYQDCFKDGQLNKRKLIRDLRNLNSNYQDYLQETYSISASSIKAGCKELSDFSGPQLHRWIDKLLEDLKDKSEVVEALCY